MFDGMDSWNITFDASQKNIQSEEALLDATLIGTFLNDPARSRWMDDVSTLLIN